MGWRWLTVAGVVSHAPCKLMGILVTPSAADAACVVYNGESDKDPVTFSAVLATKDTQGFTFPEGLELNRGLYVGSLANITGVLVMWKPKAGRAGAVELEEVGE